MLKVSVAEVVRKRLVGKVLYDLLTAQDDEEFTQQQAELLAYVREHCLDMLLCIETSCISKLKQKAWGRRHLLQDGWWSNNNNKSINHTLKACLNWKTKKLPDLTETLYGYVQSQYNDVHRALTIVLAPIH